MNTKDNSVILSGKKEIEFKGVCLLCVSNEELKERRGFTGADWWWDDEDILQVRIALELPDWRERAALATHEISEAFMCRHLGITVAQVDEFDKEYQRTHAIDINAGDEPGAPYGLPHTYATAIERIMTGVMGVAWRPYDDRLSVI